MEQYRSNIFNFIFFLVMANVFVDPKCLGWQQETEKKQAFLNISNGFLLSFLPWDPPDAHIKMPPKCQQGNGGIHQDAVFPSRALGRRRRPRLSSRAPSLSVPPANASAFHPLYRLNQTPPCILNPELDLVLFLLYQFANLVFLGCHLNNAG